MHTGTIALTIGIVAGLAASLCRAANENAAAGSPSDTQTGIYAFTVKDIDGNDVPLARYRGKVLLIVNVASRCGYTHGHYTALPKLYEQYRQRGFEILAFPANNFGNQEPGTNEQIKQFCTSKYHVTFPLFAKVSVSGDDICPLFRYLTTHSDGAPTTGDIRWNFTKFLIGRDGKIVARFEPNVDPLDPQVRQAIEKALGPAAP